MIELTASFFEQTADAARSRFFRICEECGLEPWKMHVSEEKNVVIDAVRIGSPDAPSVLTLTPGASEGEGLCASAIQCCILADSIRRELPKEVAIVLIHSVAPAWRFVPKKDLKNTERNWDDALLVAAETRFKKFVQTGKKLRQRRQVRKQKNSLTPEGQLGCLIERHLYRAERIAVLDIRTGPGSFGDCDVIACAGKTTPMGKRASLWFGAKTELDDILSIEAPGPLAQSLIANLPPVELGAAVMEFGTYSLQAVLRKSTGSIFYPGDLSWRTQVMEKAHTVLRRAIAELRKS